VTRPPHNQRAGSRPAQRPAQVTAVVAAFAFRDPGGQDKLARRCGEASAQTPGRAMIQSSTARPPSFLHYTFAAQSAPIQRGGAEIERRGQ